MKFAPLHIVTGYSFLQSGLTIEKVAKALKSNDYFGAGISDNEVMYGVPHFINACASLKKPFIIGEEFLMKETHFVYMLSMKKAITI